MARRCSEDQNIDPATHDAVEAKRKRSKRRKVAAPPADLKATEAEAIQRARNRPMSPGVMLEPQNDMDKGYTVTAPHDDLDLWWLQIADAFGTRSESVMKSFMETLRKLVPEAWDEAKQRWKTDETELNAALAMVHDVRPTNIMEAALAAQMVAIHRLQIQVSASAMNGGHSPILKEAALAAKLARAFAEQLTTLEKLRGKTKKTKQEITVSKELHQHVHYHHHRGEEENGGQAYGTSEPAKCAALPSSETPGRVVPISSGQGQAGV